MGLFIKSAQMIIITDLTTSSSSMINDAMSCEILEGLGVVELCVVTNHYHHCSYRHITLWPWSLPNKIIVE